MDWINVKDRLPKEDTDVWVVNIKYGVAILRAIYNKYYDVFVLYNPKDIETITLDITHWIEIPELPNEDDNTTT